MLHLSVPRQDTQRILSLLKAEKALPEGARVQLDPTDETRRLIPFIGQISTQELTQFAVIDVEAKPSPARTYRDHLPSLLDSQIVESIEWPTRHEFVGDLILIKLDENQRKYGPEIGGALLTQHTRTRAVFEDRGVKGTFRVRDLKLLAVKEGQNPTTRTTIIEGGHRLETDPSKVYFSTRLSHEREGTIECATKLRESRGRPLAICDPYAGVGPSILPLITVPDLVGELFVGDLNPSAVDLLRDNIDYPLATIECVDARELKNRPEMCNKFDLLLVNIPHDSLEHLSSLTPLVKEHGIVRGWAVIEDEDFENAKEHLKEIFDNTYTIEVRRSYSATANLCRFEGQITL